jgi:hypothetical protein
MPKYRAQKIDYRDADNEKTEGKLHVRSNKNSVCCGALVAFGLKRTNAT